jgi:MFS family permease
MQKILHGMQLEEQTDGTRQRSLRRLYGLIFLFSVHAILPIYVGSSFLESTRMTARSVGLLYSFAALATIIGLLVLPRTIRRYGNRLTFGVLCLLELAALLGISRIPSLWILVSFFVLHLTLMPFMALSFDLFIESSSRRQDAGSVRGMALTTANTAAVIGPAAAGMLAASRGYGSVFGVAGLFLVGTLVFTWLGFRKVPEAKIGNTRFLPALRRVVRDRDLVGVMTLQFLLQFFFAAMVVYSPIYLHEHLGMSWQSIGLVFSAMLLPFLFLEYPLGRIADRSLGEQELLVAGFFVAGGATMLLAFIQSPNPVIWAAALFTTRIGAATIEIMSDTFFFKKTPAGDLEIIGIYRMMRPVAYIIAPLTVGLLLAFFPFRFIFLFLGLALLLGIPSALALRDTR